jgi:hypothetical protein
MKNNYLHSLGLLLFGAALAGPAAAQTTPADTTHLRYGEEVAAPGAAVPVPRQELGVWKLGFNNFLIKDLPYTNYTRYGLHLAYEHQLGSPAWSVVAEVSPAVTRLHHYTSTYPVADAPTTGFALRAQLGGRYYYNREQRLRRGKRLDGFSANYVAVALGGSFSSFSSTSGRELAFFPLSGSAQTKTAPVADVALLYGLQRRLGHRGFLDASIGFGNLFYSGLHSSLVGSLRVGLVLGNPSVAYPARRASAGEVVTLRPRLYVGAQAGLYEYRMQYSERNPYPASTEVSFPNETQTSTYQAFYGHGYGSYSQTVTSFPLPYLYVGYYVAPRLAVQLGVQREVETQRQYGVVFSTPQGVFTVPNRVDSRRELAVPVVLRYSLTADFRHQVQFEVVGGLVPMWSSIDFREYAIVNHQATDQETLRVQVSTFGLHATAGFAASYGFGRRRRMLVTAEGVLNKDVRTILRYGREELQGGTSVGLRYRFGYR